MTAKKSIKEDSTQKQEIYTSQAYYIEEDEIDLVELFLILKKRIHIVVMITIAGFLISLGYIFFTRPIYETKLFVQLPETLNNLIIYETTREKYFISKSHLSQVINQLNQELKQQKLSHNLLNPEDRKKVVSVNISGRLPQYPPDVEISLQVIEPDIIPDLSKVVVEYIQNHPIIKRQVDREKELIEAQKKEIDTNILILNQMLQSFRNGTLKNVIDIGKVYDLLSARKLQKKELELITSHLKIFMLQEPSIPSSPSKPRKKLIIAVGTISSLILGVFFVFFLEWLQEVRKRWQKH